MQNVRATLEDNLVIFHKTTHTLTIQSSNHAPWYLPTGDENLDLLKKKTCAQMFIATLFIIAKNWK